MLPICSRKTPRREIPAGALLILCVPIDRKGAADLAAGVVAADLGHLRIGAGFRGQAVTGLIPQEALLFIGVADVHALAAACLPVGFQHRVAVGVPQLFGRQGAGQIPGPIQPHIAGLGLDLEHGHTGRVDVAAFQRHRTGHIAAGIHRLFIQVNAGESTLRQILADEVQCQLQAVGNILDGLDVGRGQIEVDDVQHRHSFVTHPQQYADVIAVNELLEVAVHVELFGLVRGGGHLFGQWDQFKQGADLFRQHQRHIAGSLPAGAHDHADVLGIGRGSLDLQLVVRTVGQLTGCLDAHRDDIIFFCIHGLCLRCRFRLCCGGTGRNGQRAEQEHGCQQKGNASFQFHRVLNLLFCSRAPGTVPVGKRPLRPVLYPDFTAKPAVGQ